MTRRKVVVLTTGGTIASKPNEDGRNVSGALEGESLLERIALPQETGVDVDVRSVFQKPSNAISLTDLLILQRLVHTLSEDPGTGGIVITHGTDTLEETAYFLDITLPLKRCALVLTGSQRAPHEQGTDALRNLSDAITVAADPDMPGLGATVVFNESMFAARHVRKLNSYQVQGFDAPGYGKLGYVDGKRVHLGQLPRRQVRLPLGDELPRVDIVPTYLGASGDMVSAAIERGARGLVIEGLGRGHVPPDWLDTIEHAVAAEVPVVVVSSCQEGPVNARYEFPGSLASLETHGAIAIQDLSARKARLGLSVMLSTDMNEDLATRLRQLTQFEPLVSRP